MRFNGITKLGITVVLLWCVQAAAQSDESAHITVWVRNSANVGMRTLDRAEAEASHVFEVGGIAVEWINCSTLSANCHGPLGDNEFDIHLVPNGKTSSDLVFGESFLGQDGSGKYVDIFFSRVAEVRGEPELDVAQMLGAVSAHELGHLLLGSHSHSASGIMQPIWQRESLQEIGMGKLFFTREQTRVMRGRIRRATPQLILTRVKVRSSFDDWY